MAVDTEFTVGFALGVSIANILFGYSAWGLLIASIIGQLALLFTILVVMRSIYKGAS